jgi:hypothetical protein
MGGSAGAAHFLCDARPRKQQTLPMLQALRCSGSGKDYAATSLRGLK